MISPLILVSMEIHNTIEALIQQFHDDIINYLNNCDKFIRNSHQTWQIDISFLTSPKIL